MPWGGFFDVDQLAGRIRELEDKISQPNFWTSSETSHPVIQELKRLKAQTGAYLELSRQEKELEGLLAIVDDHDGEALRHLEEEAGKLAKKVELLEFQKLLSGPADRN